MLRIISACRPSLGASRILQPSGDSLSVVGMRRMSAEAATNTSQKSSHNSEQMMPFEEFIKIKQRVRRMQLVWAMPSGFMGMCTSAFVVTQSMPDLMSTAPEEIVPILGLDPIMFYGVLGTFNGFLAMAMGHYLYGHLWHFMNSSISEKLIQRDNDFKERLARHRCEESSQFEDDYFGDKIRTVWDYRQWIRTQQQKRADQEKDKVASQV